MGGGRHALLLAAAGYETFGVDVDLDAVRRAVRAATARGLKLHAWCADLTVYPLPAASFDVVIVTRYLQRDLFPALRAALVPGGVVIYETFTERQRALGVGPRSPEHLLAEGELRARFEGFDVLFEQEVTTPEAVARLVARRPDR